jgi:hypothetical protein
MSCGVMLIGYPVAAAGYNFTVADYQRSKRAPAILDILFGQVGSHLHVFFVLFHILF